MPAADGHRIAGGDISNTFTRNTSTLEHLTSSARHLGLRTSTFVIIPLSRTTCPAEGAGLGYHTPTMPAYTAAQKDAIDQFVGFTNCQRTVASKVCDGCAIPSWILQFVLGIVYSSCYVSPDLQVTCCYSS